MREIILLIKAGIRRGKGEFSSIVILSFLVSLTLTAVLSVNTNTSNRDWEAMEEAGYYTLFVGLVNQKAEIMGVTVDDLADDIKNVDDVEKVKSYDAIQVYMEELNGEESTNRMILTSYEESRLNYSVLDGTNMKRMKDIVLKDGEIIVPFAFQSLYSCEAGDNIQFKSSGKIFRVRGFFEDPFMGGAMMGVKTLLISQNDLEDLLEEQKMETDGQNALSMFENQTDGVSLTIFLIEKDADSTVSDLKFIQYLNDEIGLEDYTDFSLSKSQANGYMMIVTNIFTGFLAAFVVLLIVIVMIVIGHGIGSSLEMEYTNLGILKALGVTGRKLKTSMLMQYFIASLAGIILGIPVAIPVIRLVNEMTRPVTGLCPSNKIAVLPCVAALAGTIGFILVFMLIKLGKVSRITPMKAIAEGREQIYFSSRFQMKIDSRGLNIWLAVRQLVSNGKNYISAGVISMLLVFFLIQMINVNQWIGEDGSSLLQLFMYYDADFSVLYDNDETKDAAEKLIEAEAGIENTFRTWMGGAVIQGTRMMCNVMDQPDQFVTVYEGRTCQYDNEVLLTEYVAKELGVNIGDTVEVSVEGKMKDYIISGYYDCANDMGSNFAMSLEGYVRLTQQVPKGMNVSYQLEEGADTDRILELLSDKFDEEQLKTSDNEVLGGVDIIVDAIHGLCILTFAIAAIFVIATVSMVCSRIFASERKDHGIYKALGFTGVSLQKQFAFRFVAVAAAGCLGGIILSILFSDAFSSMIFTMMGCKGNMSSTGIYSLILPCIFIMSMFFIGAFFKARKIRKVEPTILISE